MRPPLKQIDNSLAKHIRRALVRWDWRDRKKGFTLLELLLVIGIMGVLSVILLPSLGSLSGNGIRSASVELSGTLEQARAYAVAKNCYVFVGVGQVDSRTVVARAAVSGKGGAVLLAPVFVSKPVVLANTEMRDPAQVLTQVSLPQAAGNSDKLSDSDLGPMTFPYQGRSITAEKVLRISPSGQVTVRKDNASRYIQMGLAPAERPDSRNVALIQVAGLTGNVSVFLP